MLAITWSWTVFVSAAVACAVTIVVIDLIKRG